MRMIMIETRIPRREEANPGTFSDVFQAIFYWKCLFFEYLNSREISIFRKCRKIFQVITKHLNIYFQRILSWMKCAMISPNSFIRSRNSLSHLSPSYYLYLGAKVPVTVLMTESAIETESETENGIETETESKSFRLLMDWYLKYAQFWIVKTNRNWFSKLQNR